MEERPRTYIAIDLKSFYASVECKERGLDPLDANLVVADKSRTEKTICLAVSPALKEWGVPGRPRLFEVLQKVSAANNERRRNAPGHRFSGKSDSKEKLLNDPSLEIDFITAVPRMSLYMKYSTDIYSIYLKYVSSEDIHVYSVDEVFIDATEYLKLHGLSARELTVRMIKDVLNTTGITATAGIGTNMYLCKIAMDIVAKHIPADEDGVRIAGLDEMSYRKQLWSHEPLTDFWRVGRGYMKRLKSAGIYTMGDIAKCSVENEDILYKMFGINAELLIDHAWGYEPCTIADVKAFKPENNSMGEGQVLTEPYTFDKARVVISEMADKLALKLMDKKLMTDQIVLSVGYDVESLKHDEIMKEFEGNITDDYYGRKVPEPAHGSENLGGYTQVSDVILKHTLKLFDRIVNQKLFIRRMAISANHVKPEEQVLKETEEVYEQLEFDFLSPGKKKEDEKRLEKERSVQEAVLKIKKKYGKNAVLKGTSFMDGATLIERNKQVGGHKA